MRHSPSAWRKIRTGVRLKIRERSNKSSAKAASLVPTKSVGMGGTDYARSHTLGTSVEPKKGTNERVNRKARGKRSTANARQSVEL